MGRALIELIFVALLIGIVLTGVFRLAQAQLTQQTAPPRETDVSAQPSDWFTDSRATEAGTHTEVCIVRVARKDRAVLERRLLRVLDNREPGYAKALDEAMDEAYEAMRVANVNIRRR